MEKNGNNWIHVIENYYQYNILICYLVKTIKCSRLSKANKQFFVMPHNLCPNKLWAITKNCYKLCVILYNRYIILGEYIRKLPEVRETFAKNCHTPNCHTFCLFLFYYSLIKSSIFWVNVPKLSHFFVTIWGHGL